MPLFAVAAGLFFQLLTQVVIEHIETSTVRWQVKTLSDRDAGSLSNNTIVWTTVHEQAALPPPPLISSTARLEGEKTVYQLDGYLRAVKHEIDGDYHLIIRDPMMKVTMIAEIPDPNRAEVRNTPNANRYRIARAVIDSIAGKPDRSIHLIERPLRVRVTGVGFFDEEHPVAQEGSAPNARELHPVFSIESLNP